MPEQTFSVLAKDFATDTTRVLGKGLNHSEADNLRKTATRKPGELVSIVLDLPLATRKRRVALLEGTYGLLTVVRFVGERNGRDYYLCECSCNPDKPNTVEVQRCHLLEESVRSCGCLADKARAEVLASFTPAERKANARAGGKKSTAKRLDAAHEAWRIKIPLQVLEEAAARLSAGEQWKVVAGSYGYTVITLRRKLRALRDVQAIQGD